MLKKAAIVFWLWPAGALASIGFVQLQTSLSSNTTNVSFTGASAPGNTVVVAILYAASSTMDVQDNRGDVYVALPPANYDSYNTQLYYAAGIAAGSDPLVLTYTNPGGNLYELIQLEYSGIDPVVPVDGHAEAFGTSTLAAATPLVAHETDELLLAWCVDFSGGTYVPGPGFTTRSTFQGDLVEDLAVPSPATVTANASFASSELWAVASVLFASHPSPLDAGTPDAGTPDGGVPDTGFPGLGREHFHVGTGCSELPAELMPIFALITAAGIVLSRRRPGA